MKKTIKVTLVMVAAMLLTVSTNAQMTKGGWLVGASSNLGFSSGKVDKDQKDAQSNFNLSPAVGYFVMDNLAVGAAINFGSEKQGDVKNSSFSFGPFARYYFPMKVYGQLSYDIGSIKYDDGTNSATDKTSALTIAAGYAWMLNDNISLSPSLAYSATTYEPDGAPDKFKGSSFGLNVAFELYFGGK
jgi:outer membrane protein